MLRKLRLRGKLKGFFFLSHINSITPSNLFIFFGHLASLAKWIDKHKNLPFNDYYSFDFVYKKRYDLYNFISERENLKEAVDYLEFGVCKGDSFKWWLAHNQHPDSRFFGFDTFTGLPEDWGPFKKGDMTTDNHPPVINDSRGTFYQGLFQQTLAGFLKDYQPGKRRIIHMDADLYSSTLFVLTTLYPYLRKGDIILFDEFNVPLHEFKAFKEWSEAYYVKYEVLGAVNNYYQVAMKLV